MKTDDSPGDAELEAAYARMSSDLAREQDALRWVESLGPGTDTPTDTSQR